MKQVRNTIFFAIAFCFSSMAIAQKQEAEILADQFWQMVKADSSAFVIKKKMGHERLDAIKLSETLLTAAVSFGKPSVIDRKVYLVSQASSGLMGKGQYVCFNYRNKYKDELLGEHVVFEKLLFYRKLKTDSAKLILYSWSSKGTDINCD